MRHSKRLIAIFIILCITTLLVVLSSVVFRISEVEIYCYNATDSTILPRVQAATSIEGASIFNLNESKIIEHLESVPELADIEIINIERKFPNRVVINVVKKYAYAYLTLSDRYLVLDNAMGIMLETFTEPLDLIKISVDGSTVFEGLSEGAVVGGPLVTNGGSAETVLKNVFTALARLDYRDFDCIALINRIEVFTEEQDVIIKTDAGVTVKIFGFANMNEKMRAAVSVYLANESYRHSGIILIVENSKGEIVPTYSPNNL